MLAREKYFKYSQLIKGFLRLTLPKSWITRKGLLFCRNILDMTFQRSKKPMEIIKKSKHKSSNFGFFVP